MIAFLLYLLLFLGLIYYTGFFKLLDDATISRKQLSVLFFLKALAVPVFYFVYQKVYGGIEKFDSGKFFHDAGLISQLALTDLKTYLKLLFGLQNENSASYDFLVIRDTLNWDNGAVQDYLYNDNRVVIRIHSLLHFLAFKSYFVHALFSCFLSFTGCVCVYKSFKEFFPGKELTVLLILCFFPALWFYTGALLKEGITFFFLGVTLYQVKKMTTSGYTTKRVLLLMVLLWFAMFLKPYLLITAYVCFGCFFILESRQQLKKKSLILIAILCTLLLLGNTLSIVLKDTSLSDIVLKRQHTFSEASKGSILLSDDITFLKLPFDTSLIQKVRDKPGYYTLKKNASCTYWKTGTEKAPQVCSANQDTLKQYKLIERVAESRSNIDPAKYSGNGLLMITAYLYYTLYLPFFINAHSVLQWLASLENLVILVAQVIICIGLIRNKKNRFLPVTFLCFAIGICLLVGITTPNSGAIFRYRSPAIVFLLLSALYYTEPLKINFLKRFR